MNTKIKKPEEHSSGFRLSGRSVLGSFVSEAKQEEAAIWIPLEKIHPWSKQPRCYFSEASLQSLGASFKKLGFKGALNVRPRGDGTYELVAGERRYRAAQRAKLTSVRCIVDECTDEQALEFALLENLQRENLSKLEETEGILELIELKFGISPQETITLVGSEGHSDRQSQSNYSPSSKFQQIVSVLSLLNVQLQTFRTDNLRVLNLHEDLKQSHLAGQLSYTAAFELQKVTDSTLRAKLLQEAIRGHLSVRALKKRIKEELNHKKKDVPSSSSPVFSRITSLHAYFSKQKDPFRDKPDKQAELERLLTQLESLLKS